MTETQPKTPLEAVLAALCTLLTLRQSNDFQDVYVAGDRIEAKLACDVLVAYGFDAKLYHEDDVSVLYLKRPAPDASLESRFAGALAYAIMLKRIKHAMDSARDSDAEALEMTDYSIGFANIPSTGVKQITLQTVPVAVAVQNQPVAPAQPVASRDFPPAAAQLSDAKRLRSEKLAHKKQRQKELEAFTGGSALAKSYPGQRSRKPQDEPDGLLRQLNLYIRGNMATAVMAFFTLVIMPMVVAFTLFVMAKSVLCPDLATVKSNAWYCGGGEKPDEKK